MIFKKCVSHEPRRLFEGPVLVELNLIRLTLFTHTVSDTKITKLVKCMIESDQLKRKVGV